MAIADKLNYLLETKNQIKEAIAEKGVGMEDTDSFRSYVDKVGQLEKVSNFMTENMPDNAQYIFQKVFKTIPKDVSSFFNTIVTTSADHMFYGCENLTEIDVSSFDMSNVTNVTSMFSGCKNLVTVKGILDFTSVTRTTTFLAGCANLETINIYNFKVPRNTSFKDCVKLSHISLVYLINNLEDNTSSTTAKTITLGTENLAKLTDEEIAVATNKNWTLLGGES